MYADPYDLYGRLSMDMFLSVRLVVDTGMNALGWPRAKAVAYMREHLMESDTQIETESLRYSVDIPGQALAYKMGSRGLWDLRSKARSRARPPLRRAPVPRVHPRERLPAPGDARAQRSTCSSREAPVSHDRRTFLGTLGAASARPWPIARLPPGRRRDRHDAQDLRRGGDRRGRLRRLDRLAPAPGRPRVLLVDQYGPGNARASSGGESRVIRMGYGPDEIYTRFAPRVR